MKDIQTYVNVWSWAANRPVEYFNWYAHMEGETLVYVAIPRRSALAAKRAFIKMDRDAIYHEYVTYGWTDTRGANLHELRAYRRAVGEA